MPRIIGGLGRDGAMAEYMIVPDGRFLVRLGKLDPKAAAPLTDAALTPYHAIKSVLPALTPDSVVVMIGIGGLGHKGVQILRAVSAARLVAADSNEAKLEFARGRWGDVVFSGYSGGMRSLGLFGNCPLWRNTAGFDGSDCVGGGRNDRGRNDVL